MPIAPAVLPVSGAVGIPPAGVDGAVVAELAGFAVASGGESLNKKMSAATIKNGQPM